jgi:hypothetical protein
MMSQKFFVMILALTASVVAITVLHSHNAMASAYAGQSSGSTRISDVDVAEAVEAENATMAGGTTNQTANNGNMTGGKFLFIQNAQSGSLSQINETAYTLELNDIANKTIQFSDRPIRIVETVSTTDFIGNWSTGPDSFASDAPNDALIVEDIQTSELETAIIELFDPVYDTNTNTLTYTIMAENATSIDLPGEFGQTVLVIDDAVDGNDGITHNA